MQMSRISSPQNGKGRWKYIGKVKWKGVIRKEGTEITLSLPSSVIFAASVI